MKIRTKFLISICSIITVSFAFTFYMTADFQDKLVFNLVENQARIISNQIILTRKWVADHNGIFLLKSPTAQPNPFLDVPEIQDSRGSVYVKRNPAMVTRELSQYSKETDFSTFRVTSLHPVNPDNEPDTFEKKSLLLFESGVKEVLEIEENEQGIYLRFITPLIVNDSCLECHAKHGYVPGDIRGGLSLKIPVDWAYRAIEKNNRMLLLFAALTIGLVCLIISLLTEQIVVKRLATLSNAMEKFPLKVMDLNGLYKNQDEIGFLARKFKELWARLDIADEQLESTREQMHQAEKLAALGRLSAGIAHEINNPLGGMRNCVKSMKNNPTDEPLRIRYLDLIDKGLVRMGEVIQQLLNFGRKEPLRLQMANIDSVIQECMALLEYRMKGIDLNLDLQIKELCSIDVEAMKQIIVNLGMNAIAALSENGTLSITTRRENDSIIVSIADSGAGIEKDHLRKIFDPFFTTKDVGQGTGLGLAVTYSLVEGMGGSISVESELGVGTTFTCHFPIQS